MLITIALSLVFLSSIYILLSSRSKVTELHLKNVEIEKIYEPVSIEEKKLDDISSQYKSLQSNYQDKLTLLNFSEDRLSQYNLGVGTTDSVSYVSLTAGKNVEIIEDKLQDIKTLLKSLVSEKRACICSMGNDFAVNGKKSEAKKLFNREIKLRLRCLDNEFKAAAALVDWNNINRLVERTKTTFNEINSTGVIVQTYLKEQYLQLKIEELRLNYELSELKQDIKEAEREEARIIREGEREETRIIAAAEKAEKERIMMEKLVAKELSQLESSSQEQRELYELHKQELEVLRAKEKRAISLAQLTRAGYVYVISNELSFGNGICKIGMTRRSDPNERVKELGDASVPGLFDVHTFVYTEDAVKLEKYLHKEFAEQRVNLVNNRKEFFTISPDDALKKLAEYEDKIEIDNFEVTNKIVAKIPPIQNAENIPTVQEKGALKEAVLEVDVIQEKTHEANTDLENNNTRCTSTIDSDIITKIKIIAAREYPNDIEMQQHVCEEQLESKVFMDNATEKEIKAFVVKENPNDYSMQKYEYEEQLESKVFMDNATEKEIKAFVVKENPNDYSMQKYEYEEQLESKIFMDNVIEQDIKAIVIKENPDDYSMQKYEYEEHIDT